MAHKIIEIPDGSAVLRSTNDLTKAEEWAVKDALVDYGSVARSLRIIQKAREDRIANPDDLTIEVPHLTPEERQLSRHLSSLAIVTYLVSWTLDRSKPTTVEEAWTLPGPLYDAVSGEATRILLTDSGLDLTKPDPDSDSPTSPSSA